MTLTDNFGHRDINLLINSEQSPCVSIYLPTHETRVQADQDRIRFKNLLRGAERELREMEIGGSQIEQLLSPAWRLLEDSDFWKHQAGLLALFLCPGQQFCFRFPLQLSEQLHVGDSFHLKPLLSYVTEDTTFYLLAVSQKQVRFFEGSRQVITELQIPGMPASLDEVLALYESKKNLQFHTGTPAGKRVRAAVFHGHGGGKDETRHKARLREFFQGIDCALHEHLRNSDYPLVFAGVEYLFPLYKEVSSYGPLLERIIPGNPDGLDAATLQRKAWKVVSSVFKQERSHAVERFLKARVRGDASGDLKEILPAALSGRVETLFVPAGYYQWGRFARDSQDVELHDSRMSGDEDLFDLAAVHTYLSGGKVFVLMPDQLGDPFPLGAIYRYPLHGQKPKLANS